MTGVSAVKTPAAMVESDESKWSVEELATAKPILVYYYVDGMKTTSDDNYKFSQNFEEQCLVDKVVDQINANWVARKVGLSIDADRKLAKNQARIEFWSHTNVKLGVITIDERNQLAAGLLKGTLKNYDMKNKALCAKEIKRMEAAEKARTEAEKKAGDPTAQK